MPTAPAAAPFTLCVYCGSRTGTEERFRPAARQVGAELGRRGWRLVYGGGRAGLMGDVADATLSHGGQAVGIIPQRLMAREVGHHGLTELRVVATMHERKQQMADLADAFVALPGGIGTLEELFEVWTWRHIGYHARPIGLLDVDGFYTPLLRFLTQAVEAGFMDAAQMAMVCVDSDPVRLLDRLAEAARAAASGPLPAHTSATPLAEL